ncbi:Fungalysin metallopeptidase-domain-containing protein [Obelidium mucronatum]|nr:Fungalysin metallopeptidase-domain-containing protein [Obelidium mucronatum]
MLKREKSLQLLTGLLTTLEDVSIAHAVLARRRVNTVQETKKSLVARAVDAVYNVIPIGKSDPQNGGFAQVRTQGDKTASPNGWHNFKGVQRTDLAGNNVLAQSNEKGAFESARTLDDVIRMARPTRPDLNFNYAAASADAATTNMFYVANTMHDVFYNYGFTEAAGNFQFSNNGKGGKEDDGVIALSQDAEGKNNAWFAADVDGRAGIMKMFFFDVSGQTRDGALQNDIVIHEMGHGLSIRLTGGPSAGNCLQNGASGGLGEGWSDFFGYAMSLPAGSTRDTDYLMGNWAAPKSRPPLSTNLQRDNRKYSQIPTMLFKNPQTGQQEMEPHAVGGVWATILYEVMWNMIDISGRTAADQIVTAKNSGTGNTALINIIISAMKIQPCNPTFITARDAILQAEAQLYQGKYRCAIWSPFSKRGLGSNAREGYQDNFDLPADCISGGNPKPTTTTAPATTTTKPSTGGNLEGKPCSAPGSSQCSNAVTYLCWYSASGSYTWTKWYDGGCPAGPIDPAPTTTTTTTTNPSSGGLAGQACAIFGSSQCSKGVTYQCQYSGFNLVWAKWYDGGC